MIEKKAITQVPIDNLLARRWSGRFFDPERLLDRDQILALLEAARWAPSCFGEQPWRYVVCDRAANRPAWERALGCLSGGNQGWAQDAPLLLLVLAHEHFVSRDGNNRWSHYDTGAASENLCLQATSMGLMAHQMGGFDSDRALRDFSVPQGHAALAMIAVGYPLPLAAMSAEQQQRAQAERARWPLGELFFDGDWGQAYD
ncbi:nitroreductase [Methylohalomonas lacus]|uniref:Nitroreductase n=1 Tax=Methylohalomonas lacus TaxID=398773 RepID=A0AAE3L556_9GAMM|nr:nitroreductase family protein [Methylohalomonas lacus]MCS3902712.1 nitroreductase [Methylohalomonas lacus]